MSPDQKRRLTPRIADPVAYRLGVLVGTIHGLPDSDVKSKLLASIADTEADIEHSERVHRKVIHVQAWGGESA